MGLDMYAYAAARANQDREWWDGAELNEDKEYVNVKVAKPKELAYWRKHPNLHGWFEQEWRSNYYPEQPVDAAGKPADPQADMFNGIELEITWDMLERLESAVLNGELPDTTGFFFGRDADEEYREQDLEFIRQARAELFMGLRVFYNSSW